MCRPNLFKKSMRKFNVAWWAYSFPITILALSSTEYAHEVKSFIAYMLMMIDQVWFRPLLSCVELKLWSMLLVQTHITGYYVECVLVLYNKFNRFMCLSVKYISFLIRSTMTELHICWYSVLRYFWISIKHHMSELKFTSLPIHKGIINFFIL